MGWAAAAAAADPPPVHCSVVNNETIDSHWVAVALTSAARLAYAAAAAMNGPEPAPAYMSEEVISGGIAENSSTICVLRSLSLFEFDVYPGDRGGLDGRRFRHDDRLDAVTRRAEAGAVAPHRTHSGHARHHRSGTSLRRGGGPADRLQRRGARPHHRGGARPTRGHRELVDHGCLAHRGRRHRAHARHAAHTDAGRGGIGGQVRRGGCTGGVAGRVQQAATGQAEQVGTGGCPVTKTDVDDVRAVTRQAEYPAKHVRVGAIAGATEEPRKVVERS